MKIKTRESLKTIKTFDRADTLAQKSKSGISSLRNSAEQTQNVGYESETDYAGSELQDKEERITRMMAVGANKVGRWGVKETRKNIQKWRNRPRNLKPNPKLKQLPSPQRKALQAPKKGIKLASRRKQGLMKGSRNLSKFIKSIIGFVKAAADFVKNAVAAIIAGGWFSVLVIVFVVVVSLVVGSVYAIFIPQKDDAVTINTIKSELESEYRQRQNELISSCRYDVLNYEGDIATWDEMIAVYAVRLNLGNKPQEVATFDEGKATELKKIFWDMNSIYLRTESQMVTVTKYEMDTYGVPVEIQEEKTMIVLTVVTDSISISEISDKYGFSSEQNTMLAELLSEENAGLWQVFD